MAFLEEISGEIRNGITKKPPGEISGIIPDGILRSTIDERNSSENFWKSSLKTLQEFFLNFLEKFLRKLLEKLLRKFLEHFLRKFLEIFLREFLEEFLDGISREIPREITEKI